MSRTVEVQLKLDSQGVVQKVNAAGESFEKLAEAEKDAEQASEQVSDSQRDAAQAAEASAEAQRDAAQAAEQYATQSDRVAGAGSNASQVIFSLGDAAQDAQFGLRGVANNIAFTAESFAELQRQSGGTRTALQGVFAALKGPAGLILGLQALLALGPQIVDFFDSFIGGAEDAEEASKRLNEALDEVFDFQDADLQEIDTAIGKTRRRLRQLREEVELGPGALTADEIFPSDPAGQIQTAIETLDELDSQDVSILPGSENIQEVVRSVEAVENPAENARRALVSVLRDFRERSPQTLDEINNLEAGLERLQKKRKEVATEVEARNALSRAGVTILKEEEQAAEESAEGTGQYRKEIEKTVGALQELNRVAGAGQANFSGINEFLSSRKQKQARQMRQELRNMGVVLEDLGDKALNLGPALKQGIVEGISSAAAAAANGESILAAVGQTLGSLLQRIGKAAIAYGISLSAIKSLNPVAAIAGGTALVAAGAALSSALSDTQSAIGSGSAGRTASGERNSIEDGGELGANVDVPGRREGGAVEGGQLYETHGLGSREFFLPSGDGRIMTESAMRSQRRGSGRMSVDVSASGSITAEDFDIAALRAELNELSADVSDLT